MNITFVGSLDETTPAYSIIKENLQSLVKYFARKNDKFIIRDVKQLQMPKERIPIDYIVYEALEAYTQESGKLAQDTITIFKEPNVGSGIKYSIPHITYSATTSYRIEFYKELLNLVDVVIGVGGELGLLRLSISCEWAQKPFLVLPGAGDTSDFLWHEFFQKSHQLAHLGDIEIQMLKKSPYINEPNPQYCEIMQEIVYMFVSAVNKKNLFDTGIITPDNITIGTLLKLARRFSLGLWIVIVSFLSFLVSVSYYLGSFNLFPKP